MIVFRITKSAFAYDLSGKGAEIAGGRWNSRGTRMVYLSESRALCSVEVAVHVPIGILPEGYSIVTVEIPDDVSVKEVFVDELPPDWKVLPHSHSTQAVGDLFIQECKCLVLKVPSAVVQGDFNYLLNPVHTDIKKVNVLLVEPFEFDSRLFR